MKLTPPAAPKDEDFLALKTGLTEFNESFTGAVFREKVACFVKSDQGHVVAGVLGEINWNWLHVQGLWVDEAVRNDGWGSKLLSALEQYALDHDTERVRVETTTFQALDFYLKAGYSVFGELPDMPIGHTSYFLQKQLCNV